MAVVGSTADQPRVGPHVVASQPKTISVLPGRSQNHPASDGLVALTVAHANRPLWEAFSPPIALYQQ